MRRDEQNCATRPTDAVDLTRALFGEALSMDELSHASMAWPLES
jgi:hypothetical protein